MKKTIFIIISLSIFSRYYSQISSAAQGGDLASWTALGIDQRLSTKWQLNTTLGTGRHDTPGHADNNIFKWQGVSITKVSLAYIQKNSFVSFGCGYWRRNYYTTISNQYEAQSSPFAFRNEIRPYAILGHSIKLPKGKLGFSFRAENRYFYDQNFSSRWSTPFEFRIRWLSSYTIPIHVGKNNFLIINTEEFFATDKLKGMTGKSKWTSFQFTDTRLILFIKHSIIPGKLDIDAGIMNQLWRNKMNEAKFNQTNTFMLDLILKDLFNKKK